MFIADFHIHSKYSRATSKDCIPETLDLWARRKGLDIIGSGDFTHPAWRAELAEKLIPAEDGLYALKRELRRDGAGVAADATPRFIISGEISSIYKKNGKVRKVHNLILLPGLPQAETLSRRLEAIGNLHSDGRPILGLDSRDLLEITLEVCAEAIFIPAHIWTPHFSLFGAYSGFDDIHECFEDLSGHIHALETGLSSDPPMNWRLSALDGFTLVSNSDAHSPANLAREANLFDTGLSYSHIARALANREGGEFCGTLEFFPEEGKYHYDGHRQCQVCQKPADTLAASGICPVCGGKITVGVLHRVEALADREEGYVPATARHFESLVPLTEVIAASTGFSAISIKGKKLYEDLLNNLGTELFLLREAPLADIERLGGPVLAEGLRRLRVGEVQIQPGYDGAYGKVKILDKNERERLLGQIFLFGGERREDRSEKNIRDDVLGVPQMGGEMVVGESVHAPYYPQTHAQTSVFTAILNQEQQQAARSTNPAIAVIAGPGTGKTKTLVARIIYLVRERGVPPSHITAVTFTNKAAREMRARLEQEMGDKRAVKAMTIGTFHAICLRILSAGPDGADVTIIDGTNALSIVRDILATAGLKNSPREVLRAISLYKNGAQLKAADSAILSSQVNNNQESTPHFTLHTSHWSAKQTIYGLYQQQLAAYGLLDYDDILLRALDAAAGGAERFSYLLVDEFQDINPLQYRLIKEWGKNSAAVFVIGDPQQSIYGFRGADANCFNWFFADHPQAQCVNLIQNYRSTPQIIRCANAVQGIGGREQGSEIAAMRDSGVGVRLVMAEDVAAEALFVAKEINRMVGGLDMLDSGKGAPSGAVRGFADIAVLYRANRQAEIIERCLKKEGIPYTVAGREEFLSDPHVVRTLAFFRFLLYPADILSLRLCLKELFACPADALNDIMREYTTSPKTTASLITILEKSGLNNVWIKQETEKLETEKQLTSQNSQLKTRSAKQAVPGLLAKYAPLAGRRKPLKLMEAWIEDNALGGLESMEKLLHACVLYEDMPSLLHDLALGRDGDVRRSGAKKYARDAVSLMTLHAAKGLEFPVVFLAGLTEGLLPLSGRGGVSNLAEERRLFYVGLTRARDELLLLTYGAPSPFIADLPPDCLITQKITPRRAAREFEQLGLFS